MEPTEQTPPGLIASLRRMAEALLSVLRNRIDLFGVELQEEKARLVSALIWTAAAIFFGLLAIIFITATVVYLCPEKARPYVLIGFSLVYLLLFVNAASCLRRILKEGPPPFSESVSELKKDLAWMRSRE